MTKNKVIAGSFQCYQHYQQLSLTGNALCCLIDCRKLGQSQRKEMQCFSNLQYDLQPHPYPQALMTFKFNFPPEISFLYNILLNRKSNEVIESLDKNKVRLGFTVQLRYKLNEGSLRQNSHDLVWEKGRGLPTEQASLAPPLSSICRTIFRFISIKHKENEPQCPCFLQSSHWLYQIFSEMKKVYKM